MKQLQFGEWVIEVDIEATKEYYKSLYLHTSNTQLYRNYVAYCKNLSTKVSQFFDSLGIAPERCDVYGFGRKENNTITMSGTYCISGSIIKYPKQFTYCNTTFTEKSVISKYSRYCVEDYQFAFFEPHMETFFVPDDTPSQCVCIKFYAINIPWLLLEKCKGKIRYPKRRKSLTKLARHIHRINARRARKSHAQIILSRLHKIFADNDITYKKLSKKQTAHYMQKWFQLFVPKAQHEEAVKYCFPTKTYNTYLWHTFSYGTTPCEEKVPASKSYDALNHNACVLLLNDYRIAFVLGNANQLTSKVINKFTDIIVTDIDFKWTYVHTHEEYCGPYFAYPPSE